MIPAPATLIGARVVRSFREDDLDGARAAQALFAHFPGRWSSYGLTPVMKCALGHLGISMGDSPHPFASVGEQDAAAIGAYLAEAGVLDAVAGAG